MNKKLALSKAIALTNEILSELDDKNFEAVTRLDANRQPLIQAAFSESLEEIDQIKAHHLQSLNQQVIEKLSELKQTVLQQQRQVQNASKATRAYGSHQL
jgi:hypothetical protein